MTNPRKIQRYGWHPPIPRLRLTPKFGDSGEIVVTVIPDIIDLKPQCPPIRNQGNQGSCTGFSSASAVTFQLMKQGLLPKIPADSDVASPEFIYAVTRIDEGTFPADAGASIADTVQTIQQIGSCKESYMPYNENIYNQKPTPNAYASALQTKSIGAAVIYGNDLALIDAALANGYTVLIGVSVYSSFETDPATKTGIIPIPNIKTEYLLGGHALEIVGKKPDPSNPAKRMYNFKNSWGTTWGDKGYGWFYEDYLKNPNLSSDWHVIKLMSQTDEFHTNKTRFSQIFKHVLCKTTKLKKTQIEIAVEQFRKNYDDVVCLKHNSHHCNHTNAERIKFIKVMHK